MSRGSGKSWYALSRAIVVLAVVIVILSTGLVTVYVSFVAQHVQFPSITSTSSSAAMSTSSSLTLHSSSPTLTASTTNQTTSNTTTGLSTSYTSTTMTENISATITSYSTQVSTTSSSPQTTAAQASSAQLSRSKPLDVLFHGVRSFIFDPLHRLIFSLNMNNSISEINATTNSVINSSYFAVPRQKYMITSALESSSGTLYVNSLLSSLAGNPPFPPNFALNPQITYAIRSGRVVESIDRGYDGLLFAGSGNLFFANSVQNTSNPATITVLDANYHFVTNISYDPCMSGCRFTQGFYDPVNGYAYVCVLSVGADGGHFWSLLVVDTKSNSIIAKPIPLSNPASFAYDPSNGTVYASSAWDEGHISYCESWVNPGTNITIIDGSAVTGRITIMPNAAPTSYGKVNVNSTGYGDCLPGFFPPESGENDTLGGLAFDSNTDTLYVANGTIQSSLPSSQPELHTVVRVSSSGNVNIFANFEPDSVTSLLFDSIDGDLFVSLLN